MSRQPFFTIIVSGYQNEPYLPQCLSSIANQTYGDFEAICYVEESTDNSLAICQEWARRDPRFIVATGPKSGAVATTRNYGIDHARGEYLVVIDGDDWIDLQMLEKLAAKLHETGPLDLLAFAAKRFVPGDQSRNNTLITNFQETDARPLQVFSGLEAIRRIYNKYNGSQLHAFSWLNIYRLAFLREDHLRQLDGRLLEDFEFFPRVFFLAKKVSYLNRHFYFYRQQPNSVLHKNWSRCCRDLAYHFRSIVLFLSLHPVPLDIQAIWSNQWLFSFFCFFFYWLPPRHKECEAILKIFFDTKPRVTFWCFLLKAAWHRTLVLPLLWLAAQGWHSPANLYFHKIYPKLDWRFNHHKFPFGV